MRWQGKVEGKCGAVKTLEGSGLRSSQGAICTAGSWLECMLRLYND